LVPGLRPHERRYKLGFRFEHKDPIKIISQPLHYAEANLAQELYQKQLNNEELYACQNLILQAIVLRMEATMTRFTRAKAFVLERIRRPINELKKQRARAEKAVPSFKLEEIKHSSEGRLPFRLLEDVPEFFCAGLKHIAFS
jgi:hypothetical protein